MPDVTVCNGRMFKVVPICPDRFLKALWRGQSLGEVGTSRVQPAIRRASAAARMRFSK
jgi:hypothetical protein